MNTRANTRPQPDPADAAAAWRGRVEQKRQADRDALPDELAPPEAFGDHRGDSIERARHGSDVTEAETGRNSRTVESRLRMSCAGWRKVPTAAEFYTAVHEPTGSDRETAILLTWHHEAHVAELVYARLEGAYSWRELARALHRVGLTHGPAARRINRFAQR